MALQITAQRNIKVTQKNEDGLTQLNYETTASQVKMTDGSTVQDKVTALEAAQGQQTGTVVVRTIAERDALVNPLIGNQAWVIDASADPTVERGAAKYLYQSTADGWVKTSEAESMDIVHAWADILNKPASAVADIDAAVAARHEHANKIDLDKLSVINGQVAVDNVLMKNIMFMAELPEEVPSNLTEDGVLFVG